MLTMLRGVANQIGKVPRKLNLPMNPLVRLLFCWSVDGSNFWSSGPLVDDFIKKIRKGNYTSKLPSEHLFMKDILLMLKGLLCLGRAARGLVDRLSKLLTLKCSLIEQEKRFVYGRHRKGLFGRK